MVNRLNRPAGALTQFVRRRVQRARTRMGKQLGRWSQRMERWLEPSRIRAFALRAREVLEFAVRRARQLRLPQVAGSLTFTTVLALVPLLAVALAIFATFPMFSEFRAALEKNLLRELLPTEHASVLLTYLGGFAKKAGQLTALGLMFLVVAAMLMIATVDRTLNELWHVREKRPLVQRVLVYWALITLGPLLIGASVAAMSYVLSQSTDVLGALPRVLRAALSYTPLVLSVLAYAALYVLVPNRRVAWSHALIGGTVAALAGESIKAGFALYIRSGGVANIYGAFAVVPFFLIWVYLSWLAVLLGAAIASTIPLLRTTRFVDATRAGNDFVTAVALLRALYAAVQADESKAERTAQSLGRMTRTALQDAERLLRVLSSLGYVRPLGGMYAGQWRLTCDCARTSLRPLFEALALSPRNTLIERDPMGTRRWLAPLMHADALDCPIEQLEKDSRFNL